MSNYLLRLQWYRNRLASMSISEIRHRLLEQCKRIISKIYIPSIIENFETSSPLPKLPVSSNDINNIQNNEQLLQEWRKFSETSVLKQFQFLGINWPKNSLSNIWHFDPIKNKLWPSNEYCFNINYRNTKEYGDVKYVWELNRLQYLQPIAVLAKVEHDKQLSEYCLKEIECWIDNNPPYLGINWSSGIELACRIVSILVVITFVDNNLITTELKIKINKSLAHHGHWLMRYPSRYSSANNHLIAEASGLYLLGRLTPYLPKSKEWLTYGKNTLINETNNQLYADGVGVEQSPTYTAFTVEWLLLCGVVERQLGEDFPSKFWQRIEKTGEFLRWVTDKHGNQPKIGDDDEGRVFFSSRADKLYTTSILSCIANLTKRQDLIPPVQCSHLRELLFGTSRHAPTPLQGVKCFDQGGYTVSRCYMSDRECLLVFDHGPLGHLSIAAHGHADALSIWLHIDGLPVIVDAGTYLYHSGGNWRSHMRGTSAHNTLSINNKDSSLIAGPFNWGTKANCEVLEYSYESEQLIISATHDGYKQQYGVHHKRTISQSSNGDFIISDCLQGIESELSVEIGFLFHPSLELSKDKNTWTVYHGNKPLLTLENKNEYLQSTIKQGLEQPLQGWYSESFGNITPAQRLVFEGFLKTSAISTIVFKFVN